MLTVNERTRHTMAAFHETLLTVLRERLHLCAAKRGCNQGVCGACTVLIDGVPMRACLSLAHDCVDARITTLEGSLEEQGMRVLQDAFERLGGMQCGFCTPAMLIAARALLASNARPTVEQIQSALSGNLCRCTGYKKIIDAVLDAAVTLRGEA